MLQPETKYPNVKGMKFEELIDEYDRTSKELRDRKGGGDTEADESLLSYHVSALWAEIESRIDHGKIGVKLVLFIHSELKAIL